MEELNNPKGKSKYRRIIIISLVMLILAALAISFNYLLENAVKKKLAGYIRQDEERLYDIKMKDVSINIWGGDFFISHVSISPREDILAKGKLRSYAILKLDTFQIKGLDIPGLLLKNQLRMDVIEVISAGTKYYIDTTIAKAVRKNKVPLKDILSKQFSSAAIGEFNFTNASVAYYAKYDSVPLFVADSISMRIVNMIIDSASLHQKIPFRHKSASFGLKHLEVRSMKYYTIGIGGFLMQSSDKSLTISDFRLIPKYSKAEYSKEIPFENDWFRIIAVGIRLKGFDRELLEAQGTFSVDTLEIIRPDITIFRDKNVTDAPYKYKKLLGKIVRGIPFKVNIPNINLIGGLLTYEEIPEKRTLPGRIQLVNLSVKGHNLTNDPVALAKDSVLSLALMARLNGKGLLKLNMNVIIPDTTDKFLIDGSLGPMPLASLNTYTEDYLSLVIKSGDVKGMAFKFTATDDRAYGTMDFQYEGLSAELVTKEKKREMWLLSAAANAVVRNDNLKANKNYRQGSISVERNKDKGIPNYLVRSLISGIKTTALPSFKNNGDEEKSKQKKGGLFRKKSSK